MEAPQVSPDLASKVVAADTRNVIKGVGEGEKLTAGRRREMLIASLTPETAAIERAKALLDRYLAGETLTPAQWQEVQAHHPGFAGAAPPPSLAASTPEPASPAADGETLTLTSEPLKKAKLTKADQDRFEKLYGRNWRTIRRWVDAGELADDPCPLDRPEDMPAWWSRRMTHRIPEEIERAAVAARQSAPPPPDPAASQSASESQQIPSPDPTTKPGQPPPPPLDPTKAIRLEDFDPEEGDRLRELKQLQAAKFKQLKDALELGGDTTVLEAKYIKLCETIDKIETRVTERMKRRGLFILREEVDRDLAANAELLRQTRESMPRRVLELCPSLNAEQKLEVVAAIDRARNREESIFARLDCLNTHDLLRELAA